MNALRNTQPRLLAYLSYMVERLIWMKGILKPTGSIYLHCDPTCSHYIKVMLDGIFGPGSFRNEITWQRTDSHNTANRYGNIADTILFYASRQGHVERRLPYPTSRVTSSARNRWSGSVTLTRMGAGIAWMI